MTRHPKKHIAVRFVFGAGLILVVVTVLAVNLFADRAVRVGIESSATKTLNVAVTVSNVDLSIMNGKLALQNLLINNPPGYRHDKLLELKNAEIEIDVKSLLSDVVNIREIKLDGVDIVLEQQGISGNNLQDVITAIRSGSKEGEGKSLRVDNLEISNITVQMKLLPDTAQDDTITLELSPIRMTNLGRDNKLDMADLTGEIVLAIANRLVEQGVGVLPKDIITTLTPTLDKTIDLSTRIIESTEDIGKEITEGIKSLLKPKKEE
ncbi:MAG TPA: AsmA family protein [Sedimentisphaerales bacterium]|nr:AsmA family protein [Sedimentisphaerales bacterium]